MTRRSWWRGARRGPLALICGALMLGGALAGCAPNSGVGGGTAVASVNGHDIPLDQFQGLLNVYETNTIEQSQGQGASFAWQSPDGRTTLATAKQTTMEFLVTLELAREQLKKPLAQKDLQAAEASLVNERKQVLAQASSAPGAKQFAEALTPDMIHLLAQQQVIFSTLATESIFPTAHLRVILVKSQSQAQDLEKQAEHGADFGQLANKYNTDSTLAASSGDLGAGAIYVGQLGSGSSLAQAIDQAIFVPSAQHNKYAIVSVQGQYALIEITQRANKPLSALNDQSTEQSIFQSWVDDILRPSAQVNEYLSVS